MYSTKFEIEGFQVVSADDGEKGLKEAKAENPSIILLDILMPKMNGFEVLENLKKEEATKNIPVILLTNLNQRDEIERGLALGANDYLIKAHFMPSEVVDKIKKVLNIN
jgi:DNA-binding response OmpR family regulator